MRLHRPLVLRRIQPFIAAVLVSCLAASPLRAGVGDQFESPPVHPLDLTPDGNRLCAVQTYDQRVTVFDLTQGPLPVIENEIPVGLEPVTVRARTNTELWVVNHVSDSISIVDLTTGNVVRTLQPGDEPTDVVFAGGQAFVVVSQEDRVQVYDAVNPSLDLGSIPLDASDPRSIAVSTDGSALYVTAMDSGNRTTVVPASVVAASLGAPPPDPPRDPALPPAPDVGLIVRHDGTHWVDELGRSWDFAVGYTLLDQDLIEIDVASRTVTRTFSGLGTTLFNVAVNPVSGALYVTNQQATNDVRFEPNLKGAFIRNQVSVVQPGPGTVTPVHLNPHINYADAAGSAGERALSLAIPLDVLAAPDGQTVYVAAFGSDRVGVLDAAGAVLRRIPVGVEPAGLAWGGPSGRLYVLNRGAGTVSTVDLADDSSVEVSIGFDPVPANIRAGRSLFYNCTNASSHGDVSCASCHVFGGFDNIAWNLGDPTGAFAPPPPGQPGSSGFDPMKGPMLTQSLKAIDGTQPFHWRGGRADLVDFNGAFVSLQGRGSELSPAEFQDFTDFVFALRYPPNPNRNLDGSLPNPPSGPNPSHGEQLYLTGNLVGGAQCADCHALPSGENGLIIPASALQEAQDMVVPQLRNLYERTRFDNTAAVNVRGYGFTHDGSVDDLFSFLQFPAFTFANDDDRRDVEAFLLNFDTGTDRGVGVQRTLDGTNEAVELPTVNTLVALADAGRIGLIAKGRDAAGEARGWLYQNGSWTSDRESEPTTFLAALLADAGPGTERTFTGVLTDCAKRLGIDRDEDGFLDRTELDAGSDPGDPTSTPATVGIGDGSSPPVSTRLQAWPNPMRAGGARIGFALEQAEAVDLRVLDAAGRLVRTLDRGTLMNAGRHERRWDRSDDRGRRVPAGVYFVRLRAGSLAAGQRVVVLE